MTTLEIIEKLKELLDEFGDLGVFTTSGTWGDLEVEDVVVRPDDPPRVIIL